MSTGEGMDAMSSRDRLEIVRGMIESLHVLTHAGQRHETAKIVRLLDGEISERAECVAERSESIAMLQHQLRTEARRLMPDVAGFVACAQAVLGLVEQTPDGHVSAGSNLTLVQPGRQPTGCNAAVFA